MEGVKPRRRILELVVDGVLVVKIADSFPTGPTPENPDSAKPETLAGSFPGHFDTAAASNGARRVSAGWFPSCC
jgi:hypothetical protein